MDGGTITIGTKLETKQFDRQIEALERKVQELENQLNAPKELSGLNQDDIKDIEVELERTRNKLIKLRQEKAKVEEPKGIKELNTGISDFSKGLQSAVHRAGKLALEILGIRSAYMLLRRASSELSSYDEQYAANLEYIRFALTEWIAPALRYVVDLAMKLLSVLNSITKVWFGINMFEDASVDNFLKMKKGVGGVTGAVKELKKQLLGFDEINVLQEDGSIGSGGGGGGNDMPEFNLSQPNEEAEKFISDLKNMWEEAGKYYDEIFANPEVFNEAYGEWGTFMFGIQEVWGGIYKFIDGIVDIIKGVSQVVMGIITGDEDLINEGVDNLINGLGGLIEGFLWFLKGVLDVILGFVWGLLVTILNAVGSAIKWLLTTIWDGITIAAQWVYDNLIIPVADFFVWLWEKIVEGWHAFWNGLATGIDNAAMWVFDNILTPIGEFFAGLWEGISNGAQEAWNGITQAFSGIGEFFGGIFENIWGFLTDFASNAGEVIGNAFKGVVNVVLAAVENILNSPIRAINGLIYRINGIPGVDLGYLNEFSLPRLKVGGIINMPNTGTMVGGAIAGEAGREGVVPLTDQQAMAELGREIGKNVLINLTNITSMNGRVISRELKQVQADQQFAYNT